MARIGIDARLTYYTQGGIAQYTQHLIRELAELADSHTILALQSRKDTRDLSGAAMRRIRCWTPAHHRWERWALSLEIVLWRTPMMTPVTSPGVGKTPC